MTIGNDPVHGFTASAHGIARELRNEIRVSEAFDPPPTHTHIRVPNTDGKTIEAAQAIWDTGATHTSITSGLVRALGLKPSGVVTVEGVGLDGTVNRSKVSTYLVNLYLPNNVVLIGVKVSEMVLSGTDVLIGMDVISHGDFAITNFQGKTVWTFRMPSRGEIDFVKEIRADKMKRDAPRLRKLERRARRQRAKKQ